MTKLNSKTPAKQKGIAAITAMLVVTIATMLIWELIWELNLNVRRTENLFLRDQATHGALYAELFASQILRDDLTDSPDSKTDHPGENWAKNLPAVLFEGGSMDGRLEDMQARFNLNNLVSLNGQPDPVAVAHFRRLLTVLDLSPDLADTVLDWLDPNQVPENFGAEDGIYTSRTPPYLSANFWFITTSELLAVEGVDWDVYERLEPFVTALPVAAQARPININTASAEILASLWPGVTVEQAAAWQGTVYENTQEFLDVVKSDVSPDGQPDLAAMTPYLDLGSSYFRLNVIVSLGTNRLSMYSLLERGTDGSVTPRLRSFDAA